LKRSRQLERNAGAERKRGVVDEEERSEAQCAGRGERVKTALLGGAKGAIGGRVSASAESRQVKARTGEEEEKRSEGGANTSDKAETYNMCGLISTCESGASAGALRKGYHLWLFCPFLRSSSSSLLSLSRAT
jgi:hypothetical protein